MTATGYLEFSRLWQEQVDPLEQATLRTLASDIERTALRRTVIDFALALFAIFMVGLALSVHPAPMPVRLVLAAAIAFMIWAIWMRQRFLKATRALAALEPRAFFAAAIENARAEQNFSTFSLWTGAPAGLFILALLLVPDGLGDIDLLVREMFGTHIRKVLAYSATMIPVYYIYIPANIRLRAQVRRLEAMSREWEAEDAVT